MDKRINSHKAKVHRTEGYSETQIAYMKTQATRQEKEIGKVFFLGRLSSFSPSQVHEQKCFQWPLTSTRRAISNLTKAGILEKTDHTVEGRYGKPEHCWKWKNPNEGQQQSFFTRPTKSQIYSQ